MGRKKIDKESLEYLIDNLFHKDDIIGFQFTAGNTPLGIKENRPLDMHFSLNKSKSSVVIDCAETVISEKITQTIFGLNHTISMDKLRDYQKQFIEMGYEVEECEFAGMWYWFRVHCEHGDILKHVNRIKENLIV